MNNNQKNIIIIFTLTVYILLVTTINVAIGFASFSIYQYFERENANNNTNRDQRVERLIKTLEDGYNIEIIIGESEKYKDVYGTEPNEKQLYELLTILKEEFNKYPSSLIKNADLNTIHILNDIVIDDMEYSGGYAGYNGTLGIAYYDEDLYADYTRTTIHHELFHLLVENRPKYVDKFKEINNSNFNCQRYIDLHGRDKDAKGSEDLFNGCFINTYGINNPDEDMAIIAQDLFHKNNYDKLLTRIKTEKDIDSQKTLLNKYRFILYIYNRLSDGEMNTEYWKSIHN